MPHDLRPPGSVCAVDPSDERLLSLFDALVRLSAGRLTDNVGRVGWGAVGLSTASVVCIVAGERLAASTFVLPLRKAVNLSVSATFRVTDGSTADVAANRAEEGEVNVVLGI